MSDEEDDRPGCLTRRARGCAAVFAAMLLLLIGGCYWLQWSERNAQLPEGLRTAEVVVAMSEGVFREGCFFYVYRLHPETVRRLEREGMAFFETALPVGNYGSWRQTPLTPEPADPNSERLYALGASHGCSKPAKLPPDLRGFSVEAALERPGSYYSISSNREAMVVIVPSAGVAVAMNFG